MIDHNKYQRQRWRGKLKGKEERGVRPRQRINADKKAEEGWERHPRNGRKTVRQGQEAWESPNTLSPTGGNWPMCTHSQATHQVQNAQKERPREAATTAGGEKGKDNFPPRPQIVFLWSYCSLVDFSDKVIKPVAFSLPEALVQKFTL